MDNHREHLFLSGWTSGPAGGALADTLRPLRLHLDSMTNREGHELHSCRFSIPPPPRL